MRFRFEKLKEPPDQPQEAGPDPRVLSGGKSVEIVKTESRREKIMEVLRPSFRLLEARFVADAEAHGTEKAPARRLQAEALEEAEYILEGQADPHKAVEGKRLYSNSILISYSNRENLKETSRQVQLAFQSGGLGVWRDKQFANPSVKGRGAGEFAGIMRKRQAHRVEQQQKKLRKEKGVRGIPLGHKNWVEAIDDGIGKGNYGMYLLAGATFKTIEDIKVVGAELQALEKVGKLVLGVVDSKAMKAYQKLRAEYPDHLYFRDFPDLENMPQVPVPLSHLKDNPKGGGSYMIDHLEVIEGNRESGDITLMSSPDRNAAVTEPMAGVKDRDLNEKILRAVSALDSDFREQWYGLKRNADEKEVDRMQEAIEDARAIIECLVDPRQAAGELQFDQAFFPQVRMDALMYFESEEGKLAASLKQSLEKFGITEAPSLSEASATKNYRLVNGIVAGDAYNIVLVSGRAMTGKSPDARTAVNDMGNTLSLAMEAERTCRAQCLTILLDPEAPKALEKLEHDSALKIDGIALKQGAASSPEDFKNPDVLATLIILGLRMNEIAKDRGLSEDDEEDVEEEQRPMSRTGLGDRGSTLEPKKKW